MWARVWTSPKPMIAPFASGPGSFSPGDQYGCSTRPIEPGGDLRDQLVEQLLGFDARVPAASRRSSQPNCSANQVTIQ